YNSAAGERTSFAVFQFSGLVEARPSVAMNPSGLFDIAFQRKFNSSATTFVNLARYDVFDNPISNDVLVLGSNPSVAMDNLGNAVVAYQEIRSGGGGFDISTVRISNAGALGSVHSITLTGTNNPPGNNILPSVAMSPTDGSYVVAY